MSLFDKIFPKYKMPKGYQEIFKTLNAYTPIFTTWTGGVYESELVRAAIHARATHISKLDVSISGTAQPSLQAKLRLKPNEFQTWGQFLYRLSTILDCLNTAFIVPVFDDFGRKTGIFPALPTQSQLVSYNGVPYLRYTFGSGDTAAIELADCGVMTKFQFKDDFFGETNNALFPTMDLIHIQNQGIKEAVKSSASYRFMAQLGNFASDDDLKAERKKFNRQNFEEENGGGMLLFPNTYKDIKQIISKPFVVDDKQMELIKSNVYDYFGVNEDVIQNKSYGDAWNAFYEGAIEPFAVQFSDVVTKMLFTERERASGSFLMATSNRLQYMSNADKLNVSAQMADRGLMTRNEIRQIWNLPPLPPEIGDKLPVRGEYYNLGEREENDESTE